LLIFVAAAFVLPNGPTYALVFYLGVVPCLLARLAVRAPGLRDDPARMLALAIVVWSGLTLVWGHDDGHRAWRFAGDSLATAAFLLAMLAVLGDARVRTRLARVLVAVAAANAVFSIAVFLITHPVFRRLTGWGATAHPILGAAVMSVACLTALARVLAAQAPGRARALNLAACLVMAAFILMTESRGPMLAAGAGVVVLCAASVWRVRAFAGLGAFVLAWYALPQAVRRHGEAALIERGSSHRFEVWDYTLARIRERPLFGHGLASNLHLNVGDARHDQITFPHDLYLSLLYYSGAVGLLIFAALSGLLTWRLAGRAAWRDGEWPWLTALWLNVLTVGLTDIGQITKGPGPIWFIVWLPVGLLLTRPPAPRPSTAIAWGGTPRP
jgi:O-antigen ligase